MTTVAEAAELFVAALHRRRAPQYHQRPTPLSLADTPLEALLTMARARDGAGRAHE